MESVPLELISFIQSLRPLMRREVFDSFSLLLVGLLIGEAKYGTVRASVFAALPEKSKPVLDVEPPTVMPSTSCANGRLFGQSRLNVKELPAHKPGTTVIKMT